MIYGFMYLLTVKKKFMKICRVLSGVYEINKQV
jgi:hypothetical protein